MGPYAYLPFKLNGALAGIRTQVMAVTGPYARPLHHQGIFLSSMHSLEILLRSADDKFICLPCGLKFSPSRSSCIDVSNHTVLLSKILTCSEKCTHTFGAPRNDL